MKLSGKTTAGILSGIFALGSAGCGSSSGTSAGAHPIVGTWLVKDPNAPKGIWAADGDRIKGKWVEVIADRVTHQFTGRLEISYDIRVNGDTYGGTETVRSYDANGVTTEGPATPAPLEGKRVTLP